MLDRFLNNRRIKKLEAAIEQEDLKALNALISSGSESEWIESLADDQSLLERLILEGKSSLLAAVFERYPSLLNRTLNGTQVPELIITRSPDPLAVLDVALKAGLDPNRQVPDRTLVEHALALNSERSMLLISRLLQYGASSQALEPALAKAIANGDRPFIKFLIESGAPWSDELKVLCSDTDTIDYADRIAQDTALRNAWY